MYHLRAYGLQIYRSLTDSPPGSCALVGYLAALDALKEKGVGLVIPMAVNDAAVMRVRAWLVRVAKTSRAWSNENAKQPPSSEHSDSQNGVELRYNR